MTQANFADNSPSEPSHGQHYGEPDPAFVAQIRAAQDNAVALQVARKGQAAAAPNTGEPS